MAIAILWATTDRVYHFHFGNVPVGCSGPDDKSLVKAISGPMLVGDFTHADGSRYIMIVNKDFNGSVVCAPQFREPVSMLQLVSTLDGSFVPFEGEYTWIAPGQGVLIKITRLNTGKGFACE